jgi:histidine triad (HIT) family protein
MNEDCEFCAIVRGEGPAHLVAENDQVLAFLDIKPATRGHTLVVPKRHCQDLLDARPDEVAAVMAMAHRLCRVAIESLKADGVNLVHATGLAAHQTVFHLHVHVVPRYLGDSVVIFDRPGRTEELRQAAQAMREHALASAPGSADQQAG